MGPRDTLDVLGRLSDPQIQFGLFGKLSELQRQSRRFREAG